MQLAEATQTPELVINDDEGKQFLGSAQDVLKHYSVETTQKTIDWIAFIGAFGMIYGTRAIAINQRHKREAEARGGRRGEVIRPLRFRSQQRTAEAPAGEDHAASLIIEPQIDGDGEPGLNG